MGIIDKLKGAREKVHEYNEKREEQGRYKREMEREEIREKRADLSEKRQYYQEKRDYQKEKSDVQREKIEATPFIGTLYRGAKNFKGDKFLKATVNELRGPSTAVTGNRPSTKKSKRMSYSQPRYEFGYNPVEENIRMSSMPQRVPQNMPNMGYVSAFPPRGKPANIGYKVPKIGPSGSIGLDSSKIDKRLRKMMGV